ncbi:MAG: DNA polymerase IV, partial [Dorea sp.]
DPKIIEPHLKSHGRKLWELANGLDDSVVEVEKAEAKGIGNSTTLPRDLVTDEEAREVLLRLAESVGARLRKAGQKAGMVSVEIKYHNFESCSHQKQVLQSTNSDQMIYSTAVELFRELWNKEPIRLLGIRTSKLSEEGEPEQLTIFDIQYEQKNSISKNKKHEELDKALDKIRKKYGNEAVIRGGQYSGKERNRKNHSVLKGD